MSKSSFVLALPFLACAGPPPAAHQPQEARPPLFDFHSDPWVNLHQRLVAEATADRYWHRPVAACVCATGSAAPAWSSAVDAYRRMLNGRSTLSDPLLVTTNFELALAGSSPTLPADHVDPVVAKWLGTVDASYLRTAWPLDDARNRAWIAAVEPLVARWGRDLVAEYEKRLRVVWPTRPIRVEVTEFAGFGGAYTTTDPIFTTMSSDDVGYRGPAALEMLFHEASHGLDMNLTHELRMAAAARGKREPPSLDHAIIFYTAGALVRRRLGSTYVPYAAAQGVWGRGWERYEAALRAHWQPWLDDETDFATAIDHVVATLVD